jgi:hypothetical protein
VIHREIEGPLSRLLIDGGLPRGGLVRARVQNDTPRVRTRALSCREQGRREYLPAALKIAS